MSEAQVNWAHSVLNWRGSPEEMKRRARAVLAKQDPEGLADYDSDPIRTRGRFSDD